MVLLNLSFSEAEHQLVETSVNLRLEGGGLFCF